MARTHAAGQAAPLRWALLHAGKQLLRAADAAMYVAKRSGKGRFELAGA